MGQREHAVPETLTTAEAIRRALQALGRNRLDGRGPRTFYELAGLAKINRVQFSKTPLRGVAKELIALLAADARDEATARARQYGRRRRRVNGYPRRRAS